MNLNQGNAVSLGCECGCGTPAPIARQTKTAKGHVKGQPVRFIQGHHMRVVSDQTRAKMSAAHIGPLSPERKERLVALNATRAGVARTPETKAKISAAKKGTVFTPEHLAKLRAAREIKYPAQTREQRNAKKRREYHLKHSYGLSLGHYEYMLDRQGGVCAICKKPPVPGQKMAVDHNHATNVVRGLLHRPCNTAIAMLSDSPSVILAAHQYVLSSGLSSHP